MKTVQFEIVSIIICILLRSCRLFAKKSYAHKTRNINEMELITVQNIRKNTRFRFLEIANFRMKKESLFN